MKNLTANLSGQRIHTYLKVLLTSLCTALVGALVVLVVRYRAEAYDFVVNINSIVANAQSVTDLVVKGDQSRFYKDKCEGDQPPLPLCNGVNYVPELLEWAQHQQSSIGESVAHVHDSTSYLPSLVAWGHGQQASVAESVDNLHTASASMVETSEEMRKQMATLTPASTDRRDRRRAGGSTAVALVAPRVDRR
jgi:hypothetical protein